MKLGRLDARRPVTLSPLHRLMRLPALKSRWTGPRDTQFSYGVLGNDQVGDCVFAGFVHLVQAVCLLLGVVPPKPSSAKVVQAYFLFTHGQDSGCVEADVLQALYTTGILGINIVGYAYGAQGLTEMLGITQTFGSAYLGVMVPAPMLTQFNSNEPFDLTGTSDDRTILGGHCIVCVAFNQTDETVTVLTWGKRHPATFRWLEAYLDESWAVIPKQVKDTGTLDSLDWEQLDAELHTLINPVG